LTDLETGAAKSPAERVEQALSDVGRGGGGEIRPATVASVTVEGELRHRQDHPADVRERPLHLAGLLEDAQPGDLRGEAFAVLRAVLRTDAEEDDDTRFDFSNALLADVDGGGADPLNYRAR